MKLSRRYVEKPWGRTDLPAYFRAPDGVRVGEVWFTGREEQPLLAKYLFTSERLSIQVHPDDEKARARGLAQGKSECWLILDAMPGAVVGLGLKREVTREALRAAALDGLIEELLDWRPVRRGDFFYVAAGTVHAIGAGVTLLEFQQNADVTYRLYDYGRPRELHLDDAVAVADTGPSSAAFLQPVSMAEDRILVDGPHFSLGIAGKDQFSDRRRWIMPLEGGVRAGEDLAGAGDCLLVEAGASADFEGARAVVGAVYEGSSPAPGE